MTVKRRTSALCSDACWMHACVNARPMHVNHVHTCVYVSDINVQMKQWPRLTAARAGISRARLTTSIVFQLKQWKHYSVLSLCPPHLCLQQRAFLHQREVAAVIDLSTDHTQPSTEDQALKQQFSDAGDIMKRLQQSLVIAQQTAAPGISVQVAKQRTREQQALREEAARQKLEREELERDIAVRAKLQEEDRARRSLGGASAAGTAASQRQEKHLRALATEAAANVSAAQQVSIARGQQAAAGKGVAPVVARPKAAKAPPVDGDAIILLSSSEEEAEVSAHCALS